MSEIERLKTAMRTIQGEVLAMRAILPWLAAHVAVSTGNEPPEVIRDLHAVAQRTLDEWVIEGDPDLALRLKERAKISVDAILSAIGLTKLDDE